MRPLILAPRVKVLLCERCHAAVEEHGAQRQAAETAAQIAARRLEVQATSDYVYVIEGKARIKIGHSIEPEKRMRDIARVVREPLRLVEAWDFGHRAGWVEGVIHRHFAAARLDGEWFKLSPEKAATAIRIIHAELAAQKRRGRLEPTAGLVKVS